MDGPACEKSVNASTHKTSEQSESTPLLQNDNTKRRVPFYVNKYIVLVLMLFSLFGQNFIVDNPAALNEILTKQLHITNAEFSSFYAIYNWPNTVYVVLKAFLHPYNIYEDCFFSFF
jgi:hypothetical protein